MDNEWKAVISCEESKYRAVFIKELFLGGNFTSSEGFLKELFHL
jgi:hypothetical protein